MAVPCSSTAIRVNLKRFIDEKPEEPLKTLNDHRNIKLNQNHCFTNWKVVDKMSSKRQISCHNIKSRNLKMN